MRAGTRATSRPSSVGPNEMSSIDVSTDPARPRGRWIPWIFVAGFLVVFAVNGTMVWFAATSWTGLDADHAYDRGLAYNHNIAAAEREAALGWKATLQVRLEDQKTGDLVLDVLDRDGRPVSDARVDGHLFRPTQSALDVPLSLRPTGPGHYQAKVALPAIGLWDAHLRVVRGRDLLVVTERVVLE